MNTCYACSAPPTGQEHIPPRNLFPKESRYRVNLITVPSCDKHNSRKSNDDELLRHILVSAPQNNELAIRILEESVLPSFDRRPHILETFLPQIKQFKIRDFESAIFKLDVRRFERSIGAIVRGLYFHSNQRRLHEKLNIAWAALAIGRDMSFPYWDITLKAHRALSPMNEGMNARVFQYAFDKSKAGDVSLCRLQFYEGLPIMITRKTAAGG